MKKKKLAGHFRDPALGPTRKIIKTNNAKRVQAASVSAATQGTTKIGNTSIPNENLLDTLGGEIMRQTGLVPDPIAQQSATLFDELTKPNP